MSELTHFNEQGRARMVDISDKSVTKRTATARGEVRMQASTLAKIREGKMGKGDVLAVAQVAGIMAAKRTSELIPMCHPLPLTGIDVSYAERSEEILTFTVCVKTTGKTGVEMEALTAVQVVGLTIYDMCKAVDKGMVIGETVLVEKKGGKSGDIVHKL